jgi:murein DD-endopeptidase MepM/ murein hydrolase activator NlpD
VTSPYGWRIHPVFGDRRFHKGVDYGAPLGTPVFAVADGTVEDAGWRGNYGRYVRLDHGTGLATAYAHLSRIAKGLANGQHVRQGQVIGYVGQTGVATGPHLYYEVIVDGEQVDPLNLPDAIAVHLEGESLAGFRRYTRMLRQEASLF